MYIPLLISLKRGFDFKTNTSTYYILCGTSIYGKMGTGGINQIIIFQNEISVHTNTYTYYRVTYTHEQEMFELLGGGLRRHAYMFHPQIYIQIQC